MSRSSRDVDIELGQPGALSAPRLPGFPSFADFIAADVDAAIYRKYERLSAHKALILENQVLNLSAPTPRVLKAFKRWFLSNPPPVLWGPDENLFRDERDLVALAPVETDRLDIFLQSYFGWFLKVSMDTPNPDDFYEEMKTDNPSRRNARS
ncbi:MAG: hypothetical protein Q9184_007047, partial [Pyrenodesmia sp. 2 TL-2023]